VNGGCTLCTARALGPLCSDNLGIQGHMKYKYGLQDRFVPTALLMHWSSVVTDDRICVAVTGRDLWISCACHTLSSVIYHQLSTQFGTWFRS
jgi:hypothetical protein